MSDVLERLNAELEQMGERLRSALEGSRLRAERAGVVASRSKAAYKLGLLAYDRAKGREPAADDWDAAVARMDELTSRIAELDRRIADEEGGDGPDVHDTPAPDAEVVDAEVTEPGTP